MKVMREISKIIQQAALEFSDDDVINADDLLSKVEFIVQDDSEIQAYLVHEMLKDKVNAHYRSIKNQYSDLTEATQLEFKEAGYDHIQARYAIPVKGRTQLVPTSKMTSEMFDYQIKLHRKQGDGNYAHADELEQLQRVVFGVHPINDPEFFDHDHN